MDIAGVDGASLPVESAASLRRDTAAGEVQLGMFKKGLDLQKDLMAALFRDLGIGQNLDLRA